MTMPKEHPGEATLVLSGLQKIVGGVVLAALLGGAGMTLRNSSRLEVIDVRIENMTEKMSVQMGDRFTGAQGEALNVRLSREIEFLRARIAIIEAGSEKTKEVVRAHEGLPWHATMDTRVSGIEERLHKLEGR